MPLGVLALALLLTCASGQPSISTTNGDITIAVDTGKEIVMSVGAQTVLVSALAGLADTVAGLVATVSTLQASAQQVTSLQATVQQLQADLQQERAWREGNATAVASQISVSWCGSARLVLGRWSARSTADSKPGPLAGRSNSDDTADLDHQQRERLGLGARVCSRCKRQKRRCSKGRDGKGVKREDRATRGRQRREERREEISGEERRRERETYSASTLTFTAALQAGFRRDFAPGIPTSGWSYQ
jgi:hypothetical protein